MEEEPKLNITAIQKILELELQNSSTIIGENTGRKTDFSDLEAPLLALVVKWFEANKTILCQNLGRRFDRWDENPSFDPLAVSFFEIISNDDPRIQGTGCSPHHQKAIMIGSWVIAVFRAVEQQLLASSSVSREW